MDFSKTVFPQRMSGRLLMGHLRISQVISEIDAWHKKILYRLLAGIPKASLRHPRISFRAREANWIVVSPP